MHLIFEDEKPQKRVAVIVEKSGDEKWNSFMNGLKQAAGIANIHLIICNTDEIENADEEKNLIYDQLDNQVDAFIVQRKTIYQNILICLLLRRTITVWDIHWHRTY